MATTNDAVSGDPLVGFNFALDLGGVIKGYFTEVSGLGSESEVIEHKIIDSKTGVTVNRKVPGRLKWGDITLKRGITANMDFWNWRKQVEDGKVSEARRTGGVFMFAQEHTDPVAEWRFEYGWPSKITGPQPKSDSNEIGVEELVIVHEGIRRVK